MEQIPLPDNEFSAVTAFNSLHFAKDPTRVVEEAIRVTCPGGHLAVATLGPLTDCDAMAYFLDLGGSMLLRLPPFAGHGGVGVGVRWLARWRVEDLKRDPDVYPNAGMPPFDRLVPDALSHSHEDLIPIGFPGCGLGMGSRPLLRFARRASASRPSPAISTSAKPPQRRHLGRPSSPT
ncbi:class I SAM-dependent methyltransferase [Amycolatopsis sp. cmx-11-12]|uniref:class I SAM-dependent methyltransferase n=1 Tax=Amycolatopsis sp. cmx-11-12 TaxID=2785795 RepID=UPI0039185128